jgi:phage major head subunit gpT-like protein
LSGFSTVSLPGILGNVANKEILAGYMEEDQTWMEIAAVKSVNNFHAHTSYRMLDSLEFEELGPGGQIKHGTLNQESYTRQAKTYAKMLGITREHIINDDLGAFDDLRERLGRGAAKKFNNIFWVAFMNNASFFTTALTNYTEGATTNLGTDGVGLGLGVTTYRKMTSPSSDGTKRMGVSAGRPTILLVPPELEINARKLFVSTNFITGANATTTEANIFQGLYRPVVQDRLSDSAFTGNSTTAWYLFGTNLKPMVVSFLNGQRTPTVESTQADFNQLGIQFRGFFDFGADKSEYLAGVKVKGSA